MGVSLVCQPGTSASTALTLGMVDPDFAKYQLQLLTEEWYMHPSGMLPAYEWSLGDVNPPIHAGAAISRISPGCTRKRCEGLYIPRICIS